MEEEKLPPQLKKNVLDLQYTKYLQYFTTTVIILFTYFIGLAIAFFTKQIDVTNDRHMSLVLVISLFILGVIVICLFYFRKQMHQTVQELKQLK